MFDAYGRFIAAEFAAIVAVYLGVCLLVTTRRMRTDARR